MTLKEGGKMKKMRVILVSMVFLFVFGLQSAIADAIPEDHCSNKPKASVVYVDINGDSCVFTIADLLWTYDCLSYRYYDTCCVGELAPRVDVDSCLGVTWNDIACYLRYLSYGTPVPHCPPSPPPLPSTFDSLVVSDATAAPGDTGVSVIVSLVNSSPLTWTSIPLAYDPAVLQCDRIVLNESLFGEWEFQFTQIDRDSGLIIIGLVNQFSSDSVPPLTPGRYEIANLLFSVNATAETTTVFIDTTSTPCHWLQANCVIPVFLPGEFVITRGVNDLETSWSIPRDYRLSQNYPNPFNPQTTIRYALPQNAQVKLVVYNIAGQEIETLVYGEQEAGYHKCVWEGEDVASGIYFYRLQAGDFVQTRKMVVIR
jgi:hypothetical protein